MPSREAERGWVAESLPSALAEGVTALRAGRPGQAVEPLRTVCIDPMFASEVALADIRARAMSLLAQALYETSQITEARWWADEALRAARRLEDRAGIDAIRQLVRDIDARSRAEHERAQRLQEGQQQAERPLAEQLAAASGPVERADALVGRATLHLSREEIEDAAALAHRALVELEGIEHPEALRARTMARVASARARPEEARSWLQSAWQEAAEAQEHNLVATIARAAESLGVQVGVLHGPAT